MIKQYKNLHNYDVCGLAITNDNSKFITGGSDKVVIITDVAEGKSINKYSGHNGRINAIALN
jgi:mitogen-activated protein kinase organizer 1